jgi:hypothetical protein
MPLSAGQKPSPPLTKGMSSTFVRAVALAFVTVAAITWGKIALIQKHATVTPYWDQWDAEAAQLYKPYLEGKLSALDLVEPHNEHRIATTRLLHLGLFAVLGGRWNPSVQMYLNVALHVAAILVLLSFIRSALPLIPGALLCIFCALLFAIPCAWENALAGFQSQFYLLLVLSVTLLWTCAIPSSSKMTGVGALVVSVLLLLTMAGGSLAVMAGATILLVRRFALHERVSLVLALLLFSIALIGILATPSIEGHASLKVHSPGQFAVAIAALAAWPVLPTSANAATALLPILMQAPLAVGLLIAYRHKEEAPRTLLFFFAMACWLGLQMAALAYGRGLHCLASRYLDILAFGLVTNFAALLFLWSKRISRWRPALAALSALWLSALIYGFWTWWPMMSKDISEKAAFSRIQERNVRGYLTTGQHRWLYHAAFLEIPYPSPERLQQLLDDPTIRSILPRQLFDPSSETTARSPDQAPLITP